MHSSRMRTGRSLTVIPESAVPGGGSGSGGSGPGGVFGPRRGGSAGQVPPPTPPVNRMTDRCKNITLAKTSFRPVTRQYSSRVRTVRLPTISCGLPGHMFGGYTPSWTYRFPGHTDSLDIPIPWTYPPSTLQNMTWNQR